MESKSALLALIFIAAIALRSLFLDWVDLLDPTEARYATIAQVMFLGGDWLTPKLPAVDGITPYLGKPPLHFWLTAAAYQVFGVHEWTSRFPAFVESILLLVVIFVFARRNFSQDVAIAAVAISISSFMFFFLFGASVTDVTLTLFVTLGVSTLYALVSGGPSIRRNSYLASAFAALGFLCKGPIAPVLIGLPMLCYSAMRRDLSWIRRVPWVGVAVGFLLVAAPWFILSELKNPGTLWYFFWNENIARYLFQDYGDKYGAGHVRPYGTSLLFTLLAFSPWTFVLLYSGLYTGIKAWGRVIASDRALLFVAIWALSAPVFFLFVRQLHWLYVFPSVPPLAILTAAMIFRDECFPTQTRHRALSLEAVAWLEASVLGFIFVGAMFMFDSQSLAIGCLSAFCGATALKLLHLRGGNLSAVGSLAIGSVTVYLVVMATATPLVNARYSTSTALQAIDCDEAQPHKHRIGVLSSDSAPASTYSPYWEASAGPHENPEDISISYVRAQDIEASKVCHVMLTKAAASKLPAISESLFSHTHSSGKWLLLGIK